jgi:hypothetical protein
MVDLLTAPLLRQWRGFFMGFGKESLEDGGEVDSGYGQDNDSILTHEVAVGYQLSPRMNVRYFGNWNEYNSFSDGIHKIEFNYQM